MQYWLTDGLSHPDPLHPVPFVVGSLYITTGRPEG